MDAPEDRSPVYEIVLNNPALHNIDIVKQFFGYMHRQKPELKARDHSYLSAVLFSQHLLK